ncbi:MAG: rRNA maturation RNase YbeY [Acidobacteria bacterium RIFCSPLOWO2_02_FULL_68_18]|nr:MAG: rRNA maturation RNase YbeY [Acidobacteria bacterium RIFCSPLOWO2_02_FULL_68_18]OFW49502.1 MAG: rRNA maturation RNase YbeY [Acidobacteria bacterium RIFCSPLOWO2_12_FULL_68_19]
MDEEPPSRLRVEVVTPAEVRAPGLARWLASVAPARVRGVVTVAVVPDGRVRLLNRRYRRKNRATDVLSFPASADWRWRSGSSEERGYLGDVVIAAGMARRQARAAGHSLRTEVRILALHGLLHLLGYDHEHDAGEMARLEARLRTRGGLREGLIERHR